MRANVFRLLLAAVAGLFALPRVSGPGTLAAQGSEEWVHLSPAPPSPTGRQRTSLTHDSRAGRLLLFGGSDRSGGKNDVWMLSARADESLSWTQLLPEGKPPPPRSSHIAAFDASGNRLVIFGGQDAVAGRPLSDTWLLELGGAVPRWVYLAGASAPPPRFDSGGVYDAVNRRVVVFGGSNGTTRDLNDTWSLDLKADPPVWSQLTPGGTVPEQRDSFLTVVHHAANRMYVFGGFLLWPRTQVSDLYFLDLTLGQERWEEVSVDGVAPMARVDPAGAVDVVRNRIVLFGGWNDINQALDDVWALDLGGPRHRWQPLEPPGGGPGKRAGIAGAYDPGTARLITCCGYIGQQPVADVWGLKLSVPPTPTATMPSPTATATATETAGTTPPTSATPTRTASPPFRVWSVHLPRLVKEPRPTETPRPSATPTPTRTPCALDELEPNETRTQTDAKPPLCEDRSVEGRLTPYDERDTYWFEVERATTVEVVLANIPPLADYDLYLFDATHDEPMAFSNAEGNAPEQIVTSVAPGRYYIVVDPYQGRSEMAYLVRWNGQ